MSAWTISSRSAKNISTCWFASTSPIITTNGRQGIGNVPLDGQPTCRMTFPRSSLSAARNVSAVCCVTITAKRRERTAKTVCHRRPLCTPAAKFPIARLARRHLSSHQRQLMCYGSSTGHSLVRIVFIWEARYRRLYLKLIQGTELNPSNPKACKLADELSAREEG